MVQTTQSQERSLVHACSVFCSQTGSASYNGLARWLDPRLEPVPRGRSEADRFSSGNSCWNCSRIRLTRPVSRGRARTGNSSSPIRTKSRVVGVSARASLTWITTNCHAHWGNCINEYIMIQSYISWTTYCSPLSLSFSFRRPHKSCLYQISLKILVDP